VAAALRTRAAEALTIAGRSGVGLVVFGGDDYPELLSQIPDPPPALWVRGALDPGLGPVAIVGSRTATPHGLQMGHRLGEDLARAGLCVVSGLARGVDAAAHRGALGAGGRTIAVLGCGIDVTYPPEHESLARDIAASGALISEFAPGTPPLSWHFPRRNRVISGLCHAVVVVEASDRSGSLITARRALEQGRDVMAVPGGVLSGRNRGAHALLRDGARVVEGAQDVLEELKLTGPKRKPGENAEDLKSPDPVLRNMVEGETYDVDALSQLCGLDPVRLLRKLTELELAGWIARAGGGRFVKGGANVLR
jgi:DNA processing protein